MQTNCYLLGCADTGEAAVIDPGWSGEEIARLAREQNLTIRRVLLTHSHFDHVGGLAGLRRRVAAPIACHPEAAALLPHAAALARLWGLPLEDPPAADEALDDGDVVSVGEIRLECLFTPGHAPGHLSFYAPDEGVIFDGDVLFQGSIGRTDLPGGDTAQLLSTIRDRLLVLPDETQVLSGHGPATTIGIERATNPFLQDLGSGARGLGFGDQGTGIGS